MGYRYGIWRMRENGRGMNKMREDERIKERKLGGVPSGEKSNGSGRKGK